MTSAIYCEDDRQHCGCGHQERDHAQDLKSCLHRGCECAQFQHDAEMDQLAVDEFFTRGTHRAQGGLR